MIYFLNCIISTCKGMHFIKNDKTFGMFFHRLMSKKQQKEDMTCQSVLLLISVLYNITSFLPYPEHPSAWPAYPPVCQR